MQIKFIFKKYWCCIILKNVIHFYLMQWAAVKTQFLEIKEPPQMWLEKNKDTWWGCLSMLVSCPPTILPSNLFQFSGTLAPEKIDSTYYSFVRFTKYILTYQKWRLRGCTQLQGESFLLTNIEYCSETIYINLLDIHLDIISLSQRIILIVD